VSKQGGAGKPGQRARLRHHRRRALVTCRASTSRHGSRSASRRLDHRGRREAEPASRTGISARQAARRPWPRPRPQI